MPCPIEDDFIDPTERCSSGLTDPQGCTTLWCMPKNEVYAWRIPRETRAELEEAARRRRVPLAAVLDEIARRWLQEQREGSRDEEDEQARIRAAASRTFGAIRGGEPRRSERARDAIRSRLARRHAR